MDITNCEQCVYLIIDSMIYDLTWCEHTHVCASCMNDILSHDDVEVESTAHIVRYGGHESTYICHVCS